MNVVYVDHVHAVDAAAVPREEAIARAAGQPAHTAEAAAEPESKADSQSSSTETEEGDVRRRPQRLIPSIDRSRPPAPVPAINEPASVVIRRPAPRLIRNPGPAIVGLIHPAAIAIRRPTGAFRGKPHAAVVGDVRPLTVRIQILRARVVGIG